MRPPITFNQSITWLCTPDTVDLPYLSVRTMSANGYIKGLSDKPGHGKLRNFHSIGVGKATAQLQHLIAVDARPKNATLICMIR